MNNYRDHVRRPTIILNYVQDNGWCRSRSGKKGFIVPHY